MRRTDIRRRRKVWPCENALATAPWWDRTTDTASRRAFHLPVLEGFFMRMFDRLVWAACLVCAALAATGESAEVYVSLHGSDANPGTAEQPLRTLGRAQQVVHKIAGREPVHVFLDDGTYFLDNTLVFTPADSGTREAPVTFAAKPGAKPVVSGGRLLKLDWRPYENGILQARVPDHVTVI
ncbi:MAG: hypothetical protein D6741_08625, partial [Planctomycetota bacterium]